MFIVFLFYQHIQCSSDDDGAEDENEVYTPVVSTKQPTKHERKPSKRQKIEAAENDLIHKTVQSMDKVSSSNTTSSELDGYEDMLLVNCDQ